MQKKKIIKFTGLKMLIALTPALVFAKSFREFIFQDVLPIIDQATKALVGVAVLIMFYNIMKNVWGEASSDKFKKLSSQIMWGLLILFVMVSIWGILAIVRSILVRGL